MAKSKEELIYDIENELVDPTTNKITGERVKARLLDMVDAMGTGGGAMEYWACPPVENDEDEESLMMLAMFASQARAELGASVIVVSAMYAYLMPRYTKAMSFDMSCPIISDVEGGADTLMTVGDALANLGVDLETIGFTRITKEQFYYLEMWP